MDQAWFACAASLGWAISTLQGCNSGLLGGRRYAQGFLGGPMLDIAGSLQLLHASHVRERDKA